MWLKYDLIYNCMFYYYKQRFILLLNNILLDEILYLLYTYNLRYKWLYSVDWYKKKAY